MHELTDTDRLDALQRWLDSANLPDGTVTFTLPGLSAGHTRVGADVRATVDQCIQYEMLRKAALAGAHHQNEEAR